MIPVFLFCVLFLFACGEKEGGEEKAKVSKKMREELVEEGAVILRGQTSETYTEAPKIIYIDNIGFKKRHYGPVKFSHKKHQDEYKNPKGEAIVCTECHHDYQDDKKNVWQEGQPVKLCIECHNPKKSEGEKKKLQLAFHENCKGCHEEVVKAGIVEDAPYIKCIKCMGKKV